MTILVNGNDDMGDIFPNCWPYECPAQCGIGPCPLAPCPHVCVNVCDWLAYQR